MRKVLHFDTWGDQYTSDAFVVSCFDARFEPAVRRFLKRQGIALPDHVKVAGAAKSLASPPTEAARAFLLEQIRTSMRLHGTRRVMLFVHYDCGAYDGCQDAAFLSRELNAAEACVRREFPELIVEKYLLDFEGVWLVDGDAAAAQDRT